MTQITLKAARVNADLTLREVADKIGRNFQTVSKYEKDSSKIPIDLLQALIKLYQVSMDDIFLGESTKKNVQNKKKGR